MKAGKGRERERVQKEGTSGLRGMGKKREADLRGVGPHILQIARSYIRHWPKMRLICHMVIKRQTFTLLDYKNPVIVESSSTRQHQY